MRWHRGTLFILFAIGLAGCVIVPIPVDHTKGRAVDIDPKIAIKIGVTTREEIIARLGEPDAAWERERIIAYSWEHANWLVLFAAAVPGGPGTAGAGYAYTKQMLLIQFDASGRIARAERVERPGKQDYGDFLIEWAKGDAHASP